MKEESPPRKHKFWYPQSWALTAGCLPIAQELPQETGDSADEVSEQFDPGLLANISCGTEDTAMNEANEEVLA